MERAIGIRIRVTTLGFFNDVSLDLVQRAYSYPIVDTIRLNKLLSFIPQVERIGNVEDLLSSQFGNQILRRVKQCYGLATAWEPTHDVHMYLLVRKDLFCDTTLVIVSGLNFRDFNGFIVFWVAYTQSVLSVIMVPDAPDKD